MDASGAFASFASFESFGGYEEGNTDNDSKWSDGFQTFQAECVTNKEPGEENVNDKLKSDLWDADFQSFKVNGNSETPILDNQQDWLDHQDVAENSFSNLECSNFQQYEEDSPNNLQNDRTWINSSRNKTNISFENFQSSLRKCFDFDAFTQDHEDVSELEKSCKDSALFKMIQTEVMDPIKSKKTLTYQLKVKQIETLLDFGKIKEDWLINVQECEIGIYRNMFDFHEDSKGRQSQRKSNTEKDHPVKTQIRALRSVDSLSPKEVRRYSDERAIEARAALEYNGSSQKLLELEAEMKKSFIDLSSRSVEDLRTIVKELEIDAKIYSELLLSELDLRDDLIRQQEARNNFISKHVAVERKINEIKKKKRSYGFFKHPEEEKLKVLDWTIPYFTNENGPTTTEITLFTELLASIENDDPETPRLISEYVFKLGNTFDLDTLIKVRTENGFKTIESPREKTR